MGMRIRTIAAALAGVSLTGLATPFVGQAQAQDPARRNFNIPAQNMEGALETFGHQSGRDILFDRSQVAGRRSNAVRGSLEPGDALRRLVSGTGLSVSAPNGATFVVGRGSGEAQAGGAAADSGSADAGATPEILVRGQRPTLNSDIRRTEDDAQPYVVLTSEEIRRSGATDIEEFLQTRLPMNTNNTSSSEAGALGSSAGRITLRGLSANQTLILVDGRRVPSVGLNSATGLGQPNINGIPINAVEQIVVLPATAGGIYGGNATGGVINIILRRDYSGVDLSAASGSTFDGNAARFELGASGGFALEGGRTRITFSGSYQRQTALLATDRDFVRRANQLLQSNNAGNALFPSVGFTPNVCATIGTSTSCSGAAPSLVLDNGTPLGSQYAYVPEGYAGPGSDGGGAFTATAGRYNLNPPANEQSRPSEEENHALSLSISRQMNSSIRVFADAGFSRNLLVDVTRSSARVNLQANDPNNPFQQPVAVLLPIPNRPQIGHRQVDNWRAVSGLIFNISQGWSGSLEHSHGWTRTYSDVIGATGSFTPVAPYLRTIALRDPNVFQPEIGSLPPTDTSTRGPFNTSLGDTVLRLSGPLFGLPGGFLTASGYVEYRREGYGGGFEVFISPSASFSAITYYAPKSQEVRSGYAELRAPLLARDHGSSGLDLELMAAVRRDVYQTRTAQGPSSGGFPLASVSSALPTLAYVANNVASTDYTLGVRFSPVPDLMLRASYGTGFLPPNLGQLTTASGPQNISLLVGGDSRRGGTPLGTAVTVLTGGNPGLDPEQSSSLSFGAVLRPRFLHGLRISVDYVRIRKTDEIANLTSQQILGLESSFPSRVTRGPNQPGDLPGWAGPVTLIDTTSLNAARTTVVAYDFQLDYELRTRALGTFHPYVIGTRQTRFVRQILPTDPLLNQVGYDAAPLGWRANFGLTWELGAWRAGWDAQYFDSHNVCTRTTPASSCATFVLNQGSATISRQIYHDISLSYDFRTATDSRLRPLSNLRVTLGIQNAFNSSPPIVANASQGYDFYGDPRRRRFTLTLRSSFGR